MNLGYVECALTNLLSASSEQVKEGIIKLIKQIKEYKIEEQKRDSIHDYLPIVNQLFIEYSILLEKCDFLDREGTTYQKMDITNEITQKLSSLDFYLTYILNKPEVRGLSTTNNDSTYVRQLLSQKELVKSEKYIYAEKLRSHTTRLRAEIKNKEIEFEKSKY